MIYTVHSNENNGYALAQDETQEAGRMTYTKAGNTRIIIDHTEVDPAYNGKGIGYELFKTLIQHAREKGWKVLPLCPFAQAMFRKYDEYNDVLTH